MKKFTIQDLPKFLASIFLCLFIGFVSGIATSSTITTWYAALNKPFFTPPNWLFGPVWTILYILMGISLFLVWREGIANKKVIMGVNFFTIQLIFNFVWSFLFFKFNLIMGSFLLILALWVMIFLTMRRFYRVSKIAVWILVPYITWVTIALALNFSLILLNP